MSRMLHFDYDIRLSFSVPVSQHPFVLRCIPPNFPGQRVLDACLTLDPLVTVSFQRDSFGNLLQIGRIDEPHDHFSYSVRGTAELDFSQRQPSPCHPIFHQPSAYTRLSPQLADWLAGLSLPEDLHSRAWALAQAVHDHMDYTSGATGVTTTAAEAFCAGQGVCQDFAHVYLALARCSGLAARYVNGLPEGEGASHAWCEVWLDGIWVGIDPTRCRWADEGYLRFNAGRDFGDCPMERGIFWGAAGQTQTVFMRVTRQQ